MNYIIVACSVLLCYVLGLEARQAVAVILFCGGILITGEMKGSRSH